MRLSSEPGRGTRVELHLPALPVNDQAQAVRRLAPGEASARSLPGPAIRVLVVDDAPDVLVTVTAFLEGARMEVLAAANGEAALACLEAAERDGPGIDVLLTDFAMPGLGGVETIQRARMRRAGLAAVMITGYAGAELADLPEGVRLLHKPFQRSDLLEAVRQAVGRPELVADAA